MDFFKYLSDLKAERERLLASDILDDPKSTAERLALINEWIAAGDLVIDTARARATEIRRRLGLPEPREQKWWIEQQK